MASTSSRPSEATRDGKPLFVYLGRWKGDATMKASWQHSGYKARNAFPDAPIMGEIGDRTMRLPDYSPSFQ